MQTAIVAQGTRERFYLPPLASALPTDIPAVDLSGLEVDLSPNPRDVWCRNFGLNTPPDLFTPRQLVSLTTISDLVQKARDRVLRDALAAGLSNNKKPLRDGGTGATAYAEAIGVYLAFAVSKAADRLLQQSQHLLVEKMIDGVLAELIVGVARDEQFGPYMVVGSGGIFVELMKDSRSLLLPVTREQVLDALESLKFAPLFHGFRGKPPCDLEAAADVVLAIATLVEEQPALIAELDINPLMLLAQGHGAVAGDALISMYE